MRIGTKSFWVVFQAGWFLVFYLLGALVQLLTLGCVDYINSVTQHSPLCTNCFW